MLVTIDHIRYSVYEDPEREKNEPHIRELFDFLRQWADDRPYVTGRTSGSTGTPKEIRLFKQDMEASARLTNRFFGLGPSSGLLLCLSTSYIAGKMMVVRALLCGGNLITQPPAADPLSGLCETVDLAALVPMQVRQSLQAGWAGFDRVRQLIIGGAPVGSRLQAELQRLPTACYATYGMTETVSHIALQPLNGPGQADRFEALGDVRFEQDERGCLVICAPHLQQQTFVTNDRVRLDDARHFAWLGRHDHIINSGGIKLSPEEIEKKLEALLDLPFYIAPKPDDRLGQQVVLVVESPPWNRAAETALFNRMRQQLSRFEMPREVVYLEKFEKTDSGKLRRTT